MREKKHILCIINTYQPGYKGGGPIKTIANLVSSLGEEYEFYIVTRDRDLKDRQPYKNVLVDVWVRLGRSMVYYTSPKKFSFYGIKNILKSVEYDILYLNSFLSVKATIIPLLLRRFGVLKYSSVIIAPRGEFSNGALGIKSLKKKIYILIARYMGLYDGLIWQASSEKEKQDIQQIMGWVAKKILIAPNLLSKENNVSEKRDRYCKTKTKAVFLSRISPMKNLKYVMRILKKVSTEIDLSIYGPIEDHEYWLECEKLKNKIPSSCDVHYRGEVIPEKVYDVFSSHDVFLFPTKGENYGHVIYESLVAGTCVVVSDQTPWKQDDSSAVEVISLEDEDSWVEAVERWALYTDEKLLSMREAAQTYARKYIESSQALAQNRALFQLASKNIINSDSFT